MYQNILKCLFNEHKRLLIINRLIKHLCSICIQWLEFENRSQESQVTLFIENNFQTGHQVLQKMVGLVKTRYSIRSKSEINSHIRTISNSVRHLQSFTNTATAKNTAMSADITTPSLVITAPSSNVSCHWSLECFTVFYECFMMFNDVLCFWVCATNCKTGYGMITYQSICDFTNSRIGPIATAIAILIQC